VQKKRWIVDLLLILIIIVVGIFVTLEINRRTESTKEPPEQSTSDELIEKEKDTPNEVTDSLSFKPAKDFELKNLAGETIALSNFFGHPVIVNFWATWCPPCREEMPIFQKFADMYDTRLIVLAVNAGEKEEVVRNFVEESGLDLVFLLDPTNSAAELYGVRGFPMTFFIDEQGTLLRTHLGELDERLIKHYLDLIGLPE